MTSQPSKRNSTQCTLEAVPKSELATSYTYSVPDRSDAYATIAPAHEYYEPTHNEPVPPTRIWTRWYLLLLYGILIAVAAGVVGGFVGKSMSDKQNNNNNNNDNSLPGQSQSSSCPTIPTNASIPSPTSTPPSNVFARTIPVPTTGCNPTNVQKSFKTFSSFLDVSYTTFCMTGWQRNELVALSVASPSDCIEACVMYNGHKQASDRPCVGGGFIPAWWNQTKAMDESGGMPYNCFLKSNDTGVGRNDRDIEVVSLCLQGACNGVLG
ncbi:uncharacterized protein K460DRAFT_272257 [Cucurbitaria berberidis CBS 394.84]|uniref:Uncharacterized protein n=1 Tax=Cucurbitaria berberidis CBS 394.84 TaxID=1168544 RepID=A0A9P4GTP7_9PLEO|nr:uncharacterized protein K460DRAFT_272257 [Cucurbitaria berberidis CBS 394.84]KAF1851170.1 hypothetical protein K460DRAFT_272257 [Cucurbitaria berberidis CBS 394.84]